MHGLGLPETISPNQGFSTLKEFETTDSISQVLQFKIICSK